MNDKGVFMKKMNHWCSWHCDFPKVDQAVCTCGPEKEKIWQWIEEKKKEWVKEVIRGILRD